MKIEQSCGNKPSKPLMRDLVGKVFKQAYGSQEVWLVATTSITGQVVWVNLTTNTVGNSVSGSTPCGVEHLEEVPTARLVLK